MLFYSLQLLIFKLVFNYFSLPFIQLVGIIEVILVFIVSIDIMLLYYLVFHLIKTPDFKLAFNYFSLPFIRLVDVFEVI